jgi:hypothetical protein
MLRRVHAFVQSTRKRLGITEDRLSSAHHSEPSSEMFGEGHNLLWCQLLYQKEGTGDWSDLQNRAILELIFHEVQQEEYSRQPKNLKFAR